MLDIQTFDSCSNCNTIQQQDYKFCSNCGQKNPQRTTVESESKVNFNKNLKYLSLYSLFIVFLIFIVALISDITFYLVISTALFAIVSLVFASLQGEVWKKIMPAKVNYQLIAVIIPLAIAAGFLVSYSMDYLNLTLFGETHYLMEDLIGFQSPLILATILYALFPAFFEELAFRGFVYDNLKVLKGDLAAIAGNTFLFALIHLSFLSFIWIIPFAIVLSLLRKKYNCLLYGMIIHFTHNFTVILIEYYGWY